MSNFKKKVNDSWHILASGKATGISVNSPLLLEENENIASVNTILERHQGAITKLQRNVAWLALHGGGGSGGSGGGGSDITEAECTITVNGVTSGGQVLLGSDGLQITLNDIKAATSKLWTVTIRVGATQVAQTTASYTSPTIFIAASRITQYLQNHTGNLNVSASYEDDVKGIYGASSWSGSVLESVVELSAQNYSFNLNGLDTAQIIYEYSVGIVGAYSLNINVRKNNQLIASREYPMNILSTLPSTRSIQVKDLLGLSGNEEVTEIAGVYNLEASLVYSGDSRVNASCPSTITMVTDSILVSSTRMSTDTENPVEVSLSSSINAVWTAYLQGSSTFQYSYTINGSIVKQGATGYFGTEINDLIAIGGRSWAVEGATVPLVLNIVSGDKSTSVTYWIKFVAASDSFLEVTDNAKNHRITEFLSRDYNTGLDTFAFQEDNYHNGGNTYVINSHMEVQEKNNLSVISSLSTGMKYLRLSNGAFAKIDNWSFGGRTYTLPNLITTNQFTMSLCFKADYHPDDYRTVLYCGHVDINTGELSTGIAIDAHNIYVNNTSLVKLTDNIINNVDITVQRATTRDVNPQGETIESISYIVKIYLDGVLTAITKESSMPSLGDAIYFGGRIYSNGTEEIHNYLCDCNIYNFQLYDTVLSDLDIMVNYINNKVSTEYVNSQPNFSIISEELKKNFCERNSDGTITSYLYRNGQYTIDFLLDGNNKLSEEALNNYAKVLGIPIMLIDVHEDESWTFNNFVAQQTANAVTLGSTSGKTIQYWDPTGTNNSVLTIDDVTIELQGTSTLADAVKNLNITVPSTTAFIPKETWLPEQTYTLKADVVDSSHSNNAAIGKFINEVLGYQENDQSSYFPFDNTAISNVYNSDYKRNQHAGATLKHTVEGFPVFLIMRFNTSTTSTVSITPLGIYSFNLGRNAYRNLGFRKLKSLKDSVGDAPIISTFPYLLTDATFQDEESNANWIEIKDTTSLADLIDFTTSWDTETFDSSKGDFWQNDDSILDARYEVRYPANRNVSEYANFKNFVGNIMSLPVEGTYSTDSLGQVTRPQVSNAFKLYSVDNNNNYTPTGYTQAIVNDVNALPENLGFNEESTYKYLAIGLLFGLIDNFGKNSTYRSWNNGEYFIDFYDLDSALGGGNQGQLDITPDTWIKYLTNSEIEGKQYGYVTETYNKEHAISQTVVSANHSKLWMSIDTPFFRAHANVSANTSLYTTYWYDLRTKLDEIVAAYNARNNTEYTNFTDFFIDKYYVAQTGECGPLLFNYDYKLKYLLQFTNDSFNSTKDLTKLHGRKIAYARDWLKTHMIFLDSLFYWRDNQQTLNFKNNVNSRGSNTVYNTPDEFPMLSNAPLIMYSSVGNTVQTFYFMQKNVETFINAGSNSSNSALNWNFTNSPNIIRFGSEANPLSEMNVNILAHTNNEAGLDYNGYPAITELNLERNNIFGAGFSLNSFETGPLSELRILDFHATSGNSFALNLNRTAIDGSIYTKYTKLQEIDISESSCISNLTIPNVPLTSLKVHRSAITSFTLKAQKYLQNVDLSGCSKLQTVDIEECDGYTQVVLSNLNNLREVKILNCPNITSISISNCPNLKVVDIENNASVTSIAITGCAGLTGGTAQSYVTISECPSLTSINFANCNNLTTAYITQSNQAHVTALNLSNTKITHITGDNADTTLLDLSAFTGLTNLNCGTNSAVVNIQLANISGSPIPLTNTFQGCANLERIYGNMQINCSACFQYLNKFSIHGVDATMWNGRAIKDNGRVKMPYEILSVAPASMGPGLLFVSGKKVTNMTFTTGSSVFYGTSYTIFDVYYALSAISGNVNLSYMFREGRNTSEGRFSFANSPDRNMFAKCTQCTNLSNMFYDTGGVARLYSPTIENGTFQDDGIYSPLANLANTTISRIWGSITLYFDRNLFRKSSGKKRFTDISYHNPTLILPPDYSGTEVPTNSQIADALLEDETSYGNLTDFFVDFDVTNVAELTMNGLCNTTRLINYSCDFKVPSNVKEMRSCFKAEYSVRELVLADHFVDPSKIENIYQCFRTSNSVTNLSALLADYVTTFNITDSTLSAFTNLKRLGYYTTGDFTGSRTAASIGGAGIVKQIAQNTFPMNIVSSNTKLIQFVGFFQDCQMAPDYALSANVELPGNMFRNNPNLVNVASLFNGMKIDYTLTSNGFANCTSLEDVSYMFANSNVGGYIPAKLLFHGWSATNQTITRKGTDTVTEEDGVLVGEEETATLTGVNIPRTKITYASALFQGCKLLTPYVQENPTAEKNADWSPWAYVKNAAGEWVENQNRDTNETTIKWVYDGNNGSSNSEITSIEDGSKVGANDVVHDGSTYTAGGVQISTSSLTCPSSMNFLCAPDLLRYCANNGNLDITRMFEDCGQPGHSKQYTNNGFDPLYDGIYGRICPWLLKPVSNVTNLSYFFKNCKRVSYYQIGTGDCYTIPRDFFAYAPNVTNLAHAFRGMSFPANIDLAVFGSLSTSGNKTLDYVFAYPYFAGTSSNKAEVTGVFNRFTLASIQCAFACYGTTLSSIPNVTGQYVKFTDIFKSGYTNSTQYGTDSKFSYVFAGYSSSTVTHETTKTLVDNTTTNNYTTAR